MEYDANFKGVFCELAEPKTSKVKVVAFLAGATKDGCWYLDFADFMALQNKSVFDYETDMWLIPDLHTTESPGTKLGTYIKAMCARAHTHTPIYIYIYIHI